MGATLTEALLAPSTIRLFGRKFTGLEIKEFGARYVRRATRWSPG